jgi:hypothetical protein
MSKFRGDLENCAERKQFCGNIVWAILKIVRHFGNVLVTFRQPFFEIERWPFWKM